MRSETERQYYLGKAGIHLWYARAPLPGAAPSPEFLFPEGDDAPEAESELIVTPAAQPSNQRARRDEAGKDRLAGLQALMAGTEPETHKKSESVEPAKPPIAGPVEPSTPIADVPTPLGASTESDTAAEPGVKGQIDAHLGFWVSEQLVLVSTVSDEASERLQNTLAENILASLGESIVEDPHYIHWPVFGNPRVPGNSEDDFRHLLQSFSKGFDSRKLLLLGVRVGGIPSDRSEWLVRALGTPAVDFPRSLAELAAVPVHKRDLWEQLKSAVEI